MKLLPYLRGYVPRNTLGKVWGAIEQAGDWDKLFWWDEPIESPFPQQGDLVSFMAYMADRDDLKTLFIGEHEGELVGITWFHEEKHGTCQSGIWVAPKWRGVFSRQLVNESMVLLKQLKGIKQVFALTQWPVCRNLCRKTGFVETNIEHDERGRTFYHLTREL